MGSETDPYVFIIESNDTQDETDGLSEGRMLRELLLMMEKKVEYRYIRTTKELCLMAQQFAESRFRYLHMACHGERGAFHLTLDTVPYAVFAGIIGPALANRRLFLSACSIALPALAQAIYRTKGPYSVTGPKFSTDIDWADSAVVWSALYRLLFKADSAAIEGGTLRRYLESLCALHGVRFVHFGRNRKERGGFTTYTFGPSGRLGGRQAVLPRGLSGNGAKQIPVRARA